jgi:hypothetical protein
MRIRLSALALCCATLAVADEKPPKPAELAPVKDKLKVLSDGKKHYIVINPTELSDEHFYYGDGKTFYGQRTGSAARNGDDFSRTFWEPRVKARYMAELQFQDKKFDLQCDERHTEFKPVDAAEAKAILDGAKFFGPRWQHMAYALARDNTGKYFFVDKLREPEDNKVFRVWAGMKGAMKPQKLVNIVSDSEGDIFATKTGSLRVVLDKNESLWTAGKNETKLKLLPIEDNVVLIYSELGVYTGLPLGTPCDDL